MFSMKYSVLCSNVVVRYAVIVRNLYKMESASKVTSSERKKNNKTTFHKRHTVNQTSCGSI